MKKNIFVNFLKVLVNINYILNILLENVKVMNYIKYL